MLKMFRGRENGSRGGACRDSAQISRHLEEADTEALLDELMELTEAAANGDVDLEKIDAYLNALDEKDPLPFEIDTEAALTDFHNKHGLLIKESRAAHRRHLKTKRTASKIAAAIAVVCVTSSLVAEACGIDVFGTIARWTSEVFHFGQNETPYAEVGNYPIEIGETKEYDTVQAAVDALEITDPLMPNWVPERYESPNVSVHREASGISIHVTYESETNLNKIQFVYDETEGKWEMSYLTTVTGQVIGTEKSYRCTIQMYRSTLKSPTAGFSVGGTATFSNSEDVESDE